jgi:MFS family permease
LLSILIAGFGTSTVVNNGLTMLHRHAGPRAALTISQANAVASVGFLAGTLLIGTLAANYPDKWRLGLFLVVPFSLFIYLFVRDKSYVDEVFEEGTHQRGKMSLKFWISWGGFVACIGSEFATSFWAASLFKDRIGGSAAVATTVMLSYGLGMGLGRWYMGQILFKLHLDAQLLTVIGIQFIGFAIFWFSHTFLISIIGLFLIGAGLSTQFALASLRLIDLSDGRPDQAIGLSSLAAGIAIAAAPLALGALDDQFGISRAYIMVPILIAIAFLVVLVIPSHVSQKKVHETEGISE